MPKPTYKELWNRAKNLVKENQGLNQTVGMLKEDARIYRELIESANSIILRMDPQGDVIFINKFAQKFFGYTEGEILGQNVIGTIVPQTESSGRDLAAMIKDLGLHPERYINNENENVKNDGQKVWIAWTNKGIPNEAGNISEILCVGNDISQRRQAEEALIEKENQLRTAIESLPFDFFALDETGRYIMQNSTCKKHWGDLIGKCPEDLGVDKDTLALWQSNNRRAFAGEVVEDEVALQPHGKKEFYHNIISPIHDGDRIRGILGVNIDITKRKRAEQALQESEKKFRSVTEQSPNMIFINKDGRVVYCNKKCEELMGYTSNEFCSLDFDFFTLISPESKETVKSAFAKHRKGKEVEPYEYGLITKDGRIIDAIITTKLIQYEGDSAILGIVTNITQRKKMEKALRESEAKFRALTESAPAAILIVAEEKFLYVNPAFELITGFTRKEALVMRFWEVVHPDMREFVKARGLARQAGEAVPARYELKALTKDGRIKWIDLAATTIKYDGETATLAAAYDITERKLAEDALMVRERELGDKTHDLEEMNAALRVLLKKREDDRIELEEKIQLNVKELIEPYMDNLQKTPLSTRQTTLLGIIAANLAEIISPFARNFASIKYKFTPKEMQIASLVRQGKTTKEISEIMSRSTRTIEFHRTKIREKIGLQSKKDSLQAHLLSLSHH